MGIVCPEDRAFMACLMGECFEVMAQCSVTWFKFTAAGTITDPVYGDAIANFEAPVILQGVCQWDIQEEDLSKYGTFERGVEDDDIERPDAIVELERHDSGGSDLGISNDDEFEIKGKRYHCIGIHEPDDVLTGDLIVIVFLLERH